MVPASGVAPVATLEGNDRSSSLVGIDGPEYIRGRGDDVPPGLDGMDRVRADGGNNNLSGGPGGIPDRRERVEGGNKGGDTVSGD